MFLIACIKTSQSQVIISLLFGDKLNSEKLEFGLLVSPTACNITNLDAKYRFGLGLALYFTLQLNDKLYFQLEASPKAAMGAKGIKPYSTGDTTLDRLFSAGSVERHINTISMPLLIRYRIGGLWFAETGPQIDWMLKSQDIFKATDNNNDLTYTKTISDEITNFDVGWSAGIVYRFKKTISMSVGLRYFYGLTDMVKSAGGNQHNSAWLLNVYIPIGAGKAAERRQQHPANSK